MYVYMCNGHMPDGKSASTLLFTSLAKPQNLSLLPTPLVTERIREIYLSFC